MHAGLWKLRVKHILEAIQRILDYAAAKRYEAFQGDQITLDAVVYNFAVIGEAVRHIPGDFRARWRGVPWDTMRRMRNVIVHDYDRGPGPGEASGGEEREECHTPNWIDTG